VDAETSVNNSTPPRALRALAQQASLAAASRNMASGSSEVAIHRSHRQPDAAMASIAGVLFHDDP
jgi:hypothetical protein